MVDEATIASHKLVLWTPPADNPERRKAGLKSEDLQIASSLEENHVYLFLGLVAIACE